MADTPISPNILIGLVVVLAIVLVAYYYMTDDAAPPPPAPPAPPEVGKRFNGHLLVGGSGKPLYLNQFGSQTAALVACRADSDCSGVGTFSTEQYIPNESGKMTRVASNEFNLFTGSLVAADPSAGARAWTK